MEGGKVEKKGGKKRNADADDGEAPEQKRRRGRSASAQPDAVSSHKQLA